MGVFFFSLLGFCKVRGGQPLKTPCHREVLMCSGYDLQGTLLFPCFSFSGALSFSAQTCVNPCPILQERRALGESSYARASRGPPTIFVSLSEESGWQISWEGFGEDFGKDFLEDFFEDLFVAPCSLAAKNSFKKSASNLHRNPHKNSAPESAPNRRTKSPH